ncbi:uncharacterized protein [Gossypium hirsutum]|uniref:Uncharacterized protein n=1 Tax=Gossypium hirsutum TaxID=3635 RepID=A0A1U8KPB3_GOSHI|nr:uncharacterized protein LOC107919353 [Gossypium hirsutum]
MLRTEINRHPWWICVGLYWGVCWGQNPVGRQASDLSYPTESWPVALASVLAVDPAFLSAFVLNHADRGVCDVRFLSFLSSTVSLIIKTKRGKKFEWQSAIFYKDQHKSLTPHSFIPHLASLSSLKTKLRSLNNFHPKDLSLLQLQRRRKGSDSALVKVCMAWRETVRGYAGVEEWWRTWVHGGAENGCGLSLGKLGFLL